MKRAQLLILDDQHADLVTLSERSGESISHHVRQALRQYLDKMRRLGELEARPQKSTARSD